MAHFCEIDGRVLGGIQFRVLAKVLFWTLFGVLLEVLVIAARLTAVCSGGAVCSALRGVLLEVMVCNHPLVFHYLGSMQV